MDEKNSDSIKKNEETICSFSLDEGEDKKTLLRAVDGLFSPLTMSKLKRAFKNDPEAPWTITVTGPSKVTHVVHDADATEDGIEKKKSAMR